MSDVNSFVAIYAIVNFNAKLILCGYIFNLFK